MSSHMTNTVLWFAHFFFLLLLCFLVKQAQFRALLSPAGKQKQQGIQSLQAEMSVYLHIERGSEIHDQKWSLETHRQMHVNGRREHVLRAVHLWSDHSGRILKTNGNRAKAAQGERREDTASLHKALLLCCLWTTKRVSSMGLMTSGL